MPLFVVYSRFNQALSNVSCLLRFCMKNPSWTISFLLFFHIFLFIPDLVFFSSSSPPLPALESLGYLRFILIPSPVAVVFLLFLGGA